MTSDTLNNKTPWQDLTIGGNIYTAGNAKEFKTGDWRSTTPVFHADICKQCGRRSGENDTSDCRK